MPQPSLSQVLCSYVPAQVIRDAASLGATRSHASEQRLSGAVLFADISGFTALTERLAAKGPVGAEELSGHLAAYFGRLIDIVSRHGGEVMKFAGDAAIVIWPSAEVELPESVVRAGGCALELQASLDRYSVGEGLALSMRIGISAGSLAFVHAGGVNGAWELLLIGQPLRDMGRASAVAEPGQIVLASSARARVKKRVIGEDLPEDRFRLRGFQNAAPPQAAPPSPPLSDTTAPLLRAYIPQPVLARLDAGQGGWLAELRSVSVLFFNLSALLESESGLTERLSAGIGALQKAAFDYEGTVIQSLMDDKGLVVIIVFGLPPWAHEDDAARAVKCAVAAREALRDLRIDAPCGIASGKVFCGERGNQVRREYSVIGDTVNFSARLMSASQGILCDATTRQAAAAQAGIEFDEAPAPQLKGKKKIGRVFVPRQTGSGRFEARRARKKSGFIGRENERRRLGERLARFQAGRAGGLVVVEGEPGIGKSRLVEEILEQAGARGMQCVSGSGDAIEKTRLYHGWRTIVEGVLGLTAAQPAERRVQVTAFIQTLNPAWLPLAPLLNVLAPLEFPESELTAALAGPLRAERTRDFLASLLAQWGESCPSLVLIEDAHWLDSSSWAVLVSALESAPHLLFVLATRPLPQEMPAEMAAVARFPGAEWVQLGNLGEEDIADLVKQTLGVEDVPHEAIAFIARKAEGNPFFCEELVCALRDTGALAMDGTRCRLAQGPASLEQLDFPTTVQGVITSRIDRLSSGHQLTLKVASVIGRMFSHPVLRSVHPIEADRAGLAACLEELDQLDLTLLETPEPDLTYIFKHIITQEVAYGLLLYAQRRELHQRVAEWYEKVHRDDLPSHYAVLAHHWAGAAEGAMAESAATGKALHYLQKAGEQAIHSYANHEAAAFLSKALEILSRCPDSPDRARQELALQTAIGPAWMNVKGYASDQVEHAFARARTLCTQLGAASDLFWVVWGLFGFSQLRAQHQNALRYGSELMQIAEGAGDPTLLLEAHFAVGLTSFYLARFEDSLRHFEAASRHYDPLTCKAQVVRTGQNAGVTSLASSFLPLWHSGRPSQALAQLVAAEAVARQAAHPFSLCYALYFRCWLHLVRREPLEAQEVLDRATPLAQEHRFPIWLTMGTILAGSVQTLRGEFAAGESLIHDGLSAWEGTGAQLLRPFYMCFLAEARAGAGRPAEALQVLADALAAVEKTDERFYEPEIHRLRARLLVSAGGGESKEAEPLLSRARDIARQQGNHALELRAVVDLSALWQRHGRGSEARDLLRQTLGHFVEGANTPDLRQAAELLQQWDAGDASNRSMPSSDAN